MSAPVPVVYRGPFQGRRLSFLVEAMGRVHDAVSLVWCNPAATPGETTPWFDDFAAARPVVSSHRELDGGVRAINRTRRDLRAHFGRGAPIVYAIGSLSMVYARALRPSRLVWSINGIPEERLLHDAGLRSRALARLEWAAARAGRRPDLVVTVSERMGALVDRRLGHALWVAAPTAVDRERFRAPSGSPRADLVYVGSGAPWQGLDRLAALWAAIHERDPATRFVVVSRDERARVLVAGLPEGCARLEAGRSPDEVAERLWRARLAFLIREPGLVNETSFPTKFGEYVAAGVPVVTTDVGWDLTRIVDQTGCGIVLDLDEPLDRSVVRVLELRDRASSDPAVMRGCERAAEVMARERWVDELARAFAGVAGEFGTVPDPSRTDHS